MNGSLIKLTAYLGERDRVGGRFAAEAIAETFVRTELPVGLVLRGIEGFGVKHHLREDRLLTLSEDLPLVAVGLGSPEPARVALSEVASLGLDGLLTLERVFPAPASGLEGDAVKLTFHLGRHARRDGEPLHRRLSALLRDHGFAATIVLLGLDGAVAGERRRARLLAANVDVPLMVIAVGRRSGLEPVVEAVDALDPEILVTAERVRLCRRAGVELDRPEPPAPGRPGSVWQQLMIFWGEAAESGGRPPHQALMRDLRRAGARGATSLRGVWGFHDGQPPGGDRLWQLRRRVPVVTIVVDSPARIAEHYTHVERLTAESGVVTSEYIPAFSATGPGVTLQSLELGDL